MLLFVTSRSACWPFQQLTLQILEWIPRTWNKSQIHKTLNCCRMLAINDACDWSVLYGQELTVEIVVRSLVRNASRLFSRFHPGRFVEKMCYHCLIHVIMLDNEAARKSLESPLKWAAKHTDLSGALHCCSFVFCSVATSCFGSCRTTQFPSEPFV